LHEEVAKQARLPCSIGISGSRLVSKIASDQAKPNGILMVSPGSESAFLCPLPVGKIPGVGRTTEKQLHEMGVVKVRDILRLGEQAMRDRLGSHGQALFAIASGSRVEEDESLWGHDESAKSLSHEETFSADVLDGRIVDNTLADLAQRVAGRLRRHRLFAKTVTMKLRYSNFQTLTRAKSLREPTQIDGVLLEAARELMRENWDIRRKVRLLGLQASGLSGSAGQGNLLMEASVSKWNRALTAADRLRDRYGFDTVQLAAAVRGRSKAPESGHPLPPRPVE
jgi:DNA polymerase-4